VPSSHARAEPLTLVLFWRRSEFPGWTTVLYNYAPPYMVVMNSTFRRAITRTTALIIVILIVIAGAAAVYYYTAVPPGPAFKIAVVSDIGGRGDLAFNDMAFKGGAQAEKDFHVQMVELISEKEADYVPNLRTAAKDPDVKLIVGVGFLLSDALASVAAEYPNKSFMGIDTYAQFLYTNATGHMAPNLLDIAFEEHKGSALVGALGALLAIYYNKPYIGGVFGIEIPVLWKFEIGYKWGADWAINWYKDKYPQNYSAAPPTSIINTPKKERVLWTYTGTFSDITKGYEAAKAMYAKDAVAVYNIAGPLGLGINQAVQEIAQQRGLTRGPPFWIGVDADQDWINPGFVIASMMKRVDTGVYYATKLVVNNRFADVVAATQGTLVLGIGTSVLGEPVQGISMSTLNDLGEFVQMGVDAEKLTGKKILPMPADQITSAVQAMRNSIPSWIWQAVDELQGKISSGAVQVPLVQSQDLITYWRGILG